LVIVNHGGATGREILQLAQKVKASVHDVFGIDLDPEVNIIS
jgi:UDP-N-acetylmuramate dehydrogenase